MNEFTLIGTLESIGLLEETTSGIKFINFCVKTDRTYKSKQSCDEFRITAFKELAEDIVSRKAIGSNVLIRGRLQDNNYSKNGKTYYFPELLAEKVMYVTK